MKCQCCENKMERGDEMVWQPLGPGDDVWTLTTPGSHYRGFPTIKVCRYCANVISSKLALRFVYKNRQYKIVKDQAQDITDELPF